MNTRREYLATVLQNGELDVLTEDFDHRNVEGLAPLKVVRFNETPSALT